MAFFTSTLPGGWEVSYKTIERRERENRTTDKRTEKNNNA
jgi:hypothetical protein